jgi:hypothetical protein
VEADCLQQFPDIEVLGMYCGSAVAVDYEILRSKVALSGRHRWRWRCLPRDIIVPDAGQRVGQGVLTTSAAKTPACCSNSGLRHSLCDNRFLRRRRRRQSQ